MAALRPWFGSVYQLARFLIETKYISRGIAEPRRDLGMIGADGLHDLASMSADQFGSRGNAVNHDIDQQTRLTGWWPARYPSAAELTDAVIERRTAVTAQADLLAEDGMVERNRPSN